MTDRALLANDVACAEDTLDELCIQIREAIPEAERVWAGRKVKEWERRVRERRRAAEARRAPS